MSSCFSAGKQIIEILENGVSKYPALEGRFPQVAGISFAFDPKKPPGERVDPAFVRIGDEYLNLQQIYRLATKSYMHSGCDGYVMLKNAQIDVRQRFQMKKMRFFQRNFLGN